MYVCLSCRAALVAKLANQRNNSAEKVKVLRGTHEFPIHHTKKDGDWNIYLIKTYRKVLKTSNLAMLLVQGRICKKLPFFVPIGCVRFARYCGEMNGRHLLPSGVLSVSPIGRKPH